PPMKSIIKKILEPYGDDRVDETIEIYRDNYETEGLFETTLYSGIKDALGALGNSGYELCIATSKRHIFSEKILKNIGIYDCFSHVVGTSSDGLLDDKSVLLKHLLETRNLAK